MTNEEIEFARSKYNDLVNKRNILEKQKERLFVLEKNPAVRRYLALKKYVESEYKKEKDIYLESFYEVSFNTNSSNELLAYMGSYKKNNRGLIMLVPFNEANFVVYKDIETGTNYEVDICDKEKFEEGKNIVYLQLSAENPVSYKNAFIELRKDFYRGLIHNSQEETVSNILNKNKKLVKEMK